MKPEIFCCGNRWYVRVTLSGGAHCTIESGNWREALGKLEKLYRKGWIHLIARFRETGFHAIAEAAELGDQPQHDVVRETERKQ